MGRITVTLKLNPERDAALIDAIRTLPHGTWRAVGGVNEALKRALEIGLALAPVPDCSPEIARLRDENARLRQQLAEAQPRAPAPPSTPAPASALTPNGTTAKKLQALARSLEAVRWD